MMPCWPEPGRASTAPSDQRIDQGGVAPVEVGEAGAVGQALGKVAGKAGRGGEERWEMWVVGVRGEGCIERGRGDREGVAFVRGEAGGNMAGLKDRAQGVLTGSVKRVVVVADAEARVSGLWEHGSVSVAGIIDVDAVVTVEGDFIYFA